MAENLLIRLGSNDDDTIYWMVWSSHEHEIIASGELSSASQLSQLTEKAQSRNVIVLVPSCDVAFKSLHVPAKSQKAIRQAAPYMLEDELAQDVEQLFFAYGENKKPASNENCFIAVVEKQQMLLWQHWLNEANITTKQLIPDVLALPEAQENWQAIMIGNQVLLKQNHWQGMLLDMHLWQMANQEWSNNENVTIDAYSTLPESDKNIVINSQPEELPLALFAQNITSHSFNLLQGDFQIKTERSPLVKTWVWAAGFALFALLINITLKSVTLWQINSQQAVLEQQIIDNYKLAFPETKRVRISTIRSQLKRKMAEIGSSSTDESFLVMLTKVQPAFSQIPLLKPESLKFDSKRNELRLQATANDYQQFEKFKTILESQKLSVSQGAQNNQDNKVSGSFSITAAKGEQ
ncbi:MAG: type II secretion system protein GspL [Colwelliaceae bacterium]|nr:type II secretion system protein GspL [Colwelliaceae bacterium]